MKKGFAAFFILLFLLAGCTGVLPLVKDSTPSVSLSESNQPDSSGAASSSSVADFFDTAGPAEDESGLPGSYTVPEGWVKAEQYSTDEKIFYVQGGHQDDPAPDNISINVGTNRYSAQEHETFREAIVRQLLAQLQGSGAELTGDGTHTEQGYIVYIFTIEESDAVTKQYYILDDYRYCLVHLTSFTGEEDAYQAAQTIADSFVWADKED